MITQKAYARITLALDMNPRLDSGPWKGYHPIEALKCEIELHDEINIEESVLREIKCDEPIVPVGNNNTVSKAVDIIKDAFGINREAKISIKKSIPVQGGLAGGSTDAACVMMMLVRLWKLKCSTEELFQLGKKVGMDVPFFFAGGVCIDKEATGIPEQINCIKKLPITLYFPEDKVSTKEAYSSLDYSKIGKNKKLTHTAAESLEKGRIDILKLSIHNDFEDSVVLHHPKIKKTMEILRKSGIPCVLSGSGSTIVGIGDHPVNGICSIKTRIRWNTSKR